MTTDPIWEAQGLEGMVSQRARILGPAVWAAARPDRGPVISFSGGLPDIGSLPDDLLIDATRAALAADRKQPLEYGGTFGSIALREALAERSSRLEGIPLTADNVMVTSGSAHGIGVVCEALLDPGDIVIAESPNFPGSIRTLRTFGAELVSIPMDELGMQPEALRDALNRLRDEGRRAKLIYTIPTFQNPTGVTLPLARREAIVELAREHGVFILEDDAYGEIWLNDEPPPPSLFALSNAEIGIKACSFSKVLATGLRMAWTLAAPAVINRMASVRYDMGTSPFLGHVIAQLINSGDLDQHVVRLRRIYERKLTRMDEALQRHCAGYCTWQLPAGGFFLWLALKPGLKAADVQQAAAERGVMIGQGPAFFVDGQSTEHLRLAFSYVEMEDIEEGMHRLGEALAEVASRVPVE